MFFGENVSVPLYLCMLSSVEIRHRSYFQNNIRVVNAFAAGSQVAFWQYAFRQYAKNMFLLFCKNANYFGREMFFQEWKKVFPPPPYHSSISISLHCHSLPLYCCRHHSCRQEDAPDSFIIKCEWLFCSLRSEEVGGGDVRQVEGGWAAWAADWQPMAMVRMSMVGTICPSYDKDNGEGDGWWQQSGTT